MNEATKANIATLQKAADLAFTRYDRAFRHMGANEDESAKLFAACQVAQDAANQARYDAAMAHWDFCVLIGTSGFAIKPVRANFFRG